MNKTFLDADAPVNVESLAINDDKYDEIAYTNALAYFAKKYPELAYEFKEKILTSVKSSFNLRPEFKVLREEGKSTLIFHNSSDLILVANMMNSVPEALEKNDEGVIKKTSIGDYVPFVKEFVQERGLKVLLPNYYLLVPDNSEMRKYHEEHPNPYTKHIRVGEFCLLYYSEIYNFLLKKIKKTPYKKDIQFVEFVKALEAPSQS